MIKLETTFVSGAGGFSSEPLTYKQVKRNEKAAIYERSRNEIIKDYEVFLIKISPKGKQIFDTVLEDDTENYPSTNQFGHSAWSCLTLKAATDRFNRICEPEKEIEAKELALPKKEFTTSDFAKLNSLSYSEAYISMKSLIEQKKIKFIREKNMNKDGRGKASKFYKAS